MKFKTADKIESVVWALKISDIPRSQNRARIDSLFNGNPPYSQQEVVRDNVNVNVNFLESTQIAHNARRQYSNAFLKPGNFFSVRLDSGPVHKRSEWSHIITQEINRLMKKSRHYRETLRNVFAQVVIHGVGPATWNSREDWVPDMQMMSDVFIPSQTLLTMENLPYFSIYRRYTAEELWRKINGPKVDPGWEVETVNACIQWAYNQWGATNTVNDSIYNPERLQEDIKANLGWFGTDQVPTINCHDFYYLDDTDKNYGWRRKIVLDTPNMDGAVPDLASVESSKNFLGNRGQFLYDSKNRKYASDIEEIIHFQFADGSVVAPFRYHSVRGLGFLLYSVCHLQNRLRSSYNAHVFESLLQYFRVSNPDDSERITKVDLINKGIIPDGVQFVPINERWQIRSDLVGQAMSLNRQSMEDSSASSTQDFEFNKDQVEKTATQYVGEANATSAMVSAMLQEAYGYQEFQYYEIARRFCIPNSRNKDARDFRLQCLKRGVPEEMLDSNRWNISAERIIGSGNKQLEISQTGMLMQQYNRYDPEAQRKILRDFTFAVVDDAAKADDLVPFIRNETSASKSFGQVSVGTLMFGTPVGIPPGLNRIEVTEAWLGEMAAIMAPIEQSGGMPTKEQVTGLANIAAHIEQQIKIIAADPEEKDRVKQYSDDLSQMNNVLRAYAQRVQQQQGAQGQGGNGEVQSKIVSAAITAQAQAKIKEEKSAQQIAHKQIAFNQEQNRKDAAAEQDRQLRLQEAHTDAAAKDIETVATVNRQGLKPDQGNES